MATLSGQTIQSTYQGLLKLDDSTSGITSTYQQIQDGLGNDTGVKIKQNNLISPNLWGAQPYKADYYGAGFTANPGSWSSGVVNVMNSVLFYDLGIYDYSGITYSINTATTTQVETFNVAFYSSQYISGIGLAPKDVILSGITLTTSAPTGVKTVNFGSNLSFSGLGAGYYFMSFIIATTGSTPQSTFRVSPAIVPNIAQIPAGFILDRTNTGAQTPVKGSTTSPCITYSGVTSFPNTMSAAQAATFNSTVTNVAIGFLLNTVK